MNAPAEKTEFDLWLGSVFIGWRAGAVGFTLWFLVQALRSSAGDGVLGYIVFLVLLSVAYFAGCIVISLPLYLVLRRVSRAGPSYLWAVAGAVALAGACFGYTLLRPDNLLEVRDLPNRIFVSTLAAIAGGVTFFAMKRKLSESQVLTLRSSEHDYE